MKQENLWRRFVFWLNPECERLDIMEIKNSEERKHRLVQLAEKLGMSTAWRTKDSPGEAEVNLINRILEGERALRESRVWIIQVIVASAALFSAAAAWAAVWNG